MAYRKEGAEEDLTSSAAGREDKDGKSDCFHVWAVCGEEATRSMCSVKSLDAGQTWEILKEILGSFFIPLKVVSPPPSLTALQSLLDLIIAALL